MKQSYLKVPSLYECRHCKRLLEVEKYRSYLREEVEQERIHHVFSPNTQPFLVLCTCGHCTVVSRTERDLDNKAL